MKKQKVLIVEDDLPNLISAFNAIIEIGKNKGIEIEAEGADTYERFLKMLDEFKPDIVLSDATIPEKMGKTPYDFREKIAEELEKRNIPYIFVTRAPIPGTHSYNVNIVKKERGEYKTLKEFNTPEKDKEIWEEAYDLLINGF